jgi:hypothetical protein
LLRTTANGGRSESVYYVTTLNDSGPSTFRDAGSKPNNSSLSLLRIQSAADAFEAVMKEAGASLQRDAIDNRLISYVASLGKIGKVIEDEAEVGGQLNYKKIKAYQDSDKDGIPNNWEKATLNADETLLGGAHSTDAEKAVLKANPVKSEYFNKILWYDLQQPRGGMFAVGGTNITTGEEIKYSHERNQWSVHYTQSPDQKLFAGDGGDSAAVAKATDGKWINLFIPAGDRFNYEQLVNMKFHQYKLEPNVHFSPDGKWIIFRSNFEGFESVYAVEIAKNKI